MTEHSLNDPSLKSLEARLASSVPSISPADQQQLLYQCAFAAGRRATMRMVRRWQAATAVLASLVIAVCLPQFMAPSRVAIQPPPKSAPDKNIEQTRSVLPADRDPIVQANERPVTIQLDAWQIPHADNLLNSQALAQHEADASVNSVRSLTKQFLR